MENSWTPCSHIHQPHHHFHHHHHIKLCPHHRHHHHHHMVLCPHHHPHHHHFYSPASAPVPPQNPETVTAASLQRNFNLGAPTVSTEAHNPSAQMFPEVEPEALEEEEEEEDGEPIFVLTDEWREFFAKSEARRKLEKKQAEKKQAKKKK